MIDKMKTEPFETQPTPSIPISTPDPEDNSVNPKYQPPPKPKINYMYSNCEYELEPETKMFCNDQVNLYSRVSMNQQLAGKANPKTLIQPVSVPPVFDPSWRSTNMTVDFKGNNNREPVLDLYQSGYISIDDMKEQRQYESYQSNYASHPSNMREPQYNRTRKKEFNDMNDDNSFHNRNMNTQTIQPGVYFKNEVMEPVSSNIGITETKRSIHPVKTIDDNGDIYYNEYNNDARFKRITPKDVGPEDIYDPRFTGYGTSYRSYFEPVTGQTRFMYDDVNAIRMPNYVVRSKIDHLPYADTYGPIQEGSEFGNIHNPHIRYLAQDSWMRDSLDFRNDMTQLLMRKRNSEAWQQRQAPLGPRSLVRRGGV